ncbi:hypothetical protein [Nocardia sp. CC227C]|uniref:hypothetical protein n=1 Tax=Nocardia sp. CC227C TaxID=3044562 RepID=UPI00278BD24A|nr:hypothetical protein [Nocardia sp. CC227C]
MSKSEPYSSGPDDHSGSNGMDDSGRPSGMWLVLPAMFAVGWAAGVLTRRRKQG